MSQNKHHNAVFRSRQNHPTTYDESPSFRGPIVLEPTLSTAAYHVRLKNYYLKNGLRLPKEPLMPLQKSSPTLPMLQTIVDQLAYRDAPIDVKEVAESVEFYLRTRKRLLGSASKAKGASQSTEGNEEYVIVYDLCSGHGLTGMLFAACNPFDGGGGKLSVRTVLVDQTEPPSYKIIRKVLAEVCPWIDEEQNSIKFVTASLDNFDDAIRNLDSDGDGSLPPISIVISTHACGSLTDQVLHHAVSFEACGVAVMPCCYTGTDKGAPYGIKRALGVSWAADIRRSFYLTEHGYHSDFATIPSQITPMNRIVLGEKRKF